LISAASPGVPERKGAIAGLARSPHTDVI
jgi:hypothetical protein